MLDQFGKNLNSLDSVLAGQNEQELMEQLEMDAPKLDFSISKAETETQSANDFSISDIHLYVSSTVSPKCNYAFKNVQSQQNILVS